MKKLYLALFFTGFVCFAAFARDITVTAVDADLDIALEGAVINLPDGAKVTANRQGRAVVTVPDGRETLLRRSYPGYETYRVLIPANGGSNAITAAMRMGTMMENKELIIEADKTAGGVGTQAGRSVSISGDSLRQMAQIGVMEDVMTAVKLLPGVSYTSGGQASPSIRGGEPGDIMAVYDGYYVTNPYFWGGQISIFDPRAVEKAQLSHGVFSSRFGHT
ncbi:MAG: Plug domain-containing protein, partial [Spirochaetaceae bacterium]|nr:Plug domain-containing protein [Spirochaetaceae bacterium]